jgi:hypothetical protein
MEGASRAAFEARPPEFPQGSQLGAVELRRIPIIRNGEIVAYEERENLIPELAPGVENIIQQRERATALGQAEGQTETVYNPSTMQNELVSRGRIVGSGGSAGMGVGAGGQAGGGRGAGGFATGPSILEETSLRALGGAFEKRIQNITEKGLDAGQRAFQANELYNTVSEIDPTALTAIGATVVPYIRAIPGFREITDNFATNTALLGQQYARGALGNFAMVKGNLNAQEVRLVENATWQKWDPRTATRYIAALEAAFADKDASQMEFANTYQGDFREYDSAWRNSPQNQSVFNHPMMTRFVTDEINEAIAKTRPGTDPVFNLPPGFSVEGMTRDYGVPVKKPDGSVFVVR